VSWVQDLQTSMAFNSTIVLRNNDVKEYHAHERHYHARRQMPQEIPKDADTVWIQHISIQHKDAYD
jgi:hypothetical protein